MDFIKSIIISAFGLTIVSIDIKVVDASSLILLTVVNSIERKKYIYMDENIYYDILNDDRL